MAARRSTLGSADMQPALVEFDLMPLEAADFRSPQAVAIGDQDHRGIAVTTSTHLAGSVHKPLDLASPDDVSIQAAIEANDQFTAALEQIRDRAQTLTLDQA